MMSGLLNAMRQQAQMAGQDRAASRMGIVSGYNPSNYCAKVRLMPEDVETGWLPIASMWVGAGWGMFSPPMLGEVVEVCFQEDDVDAGYIGHRLFHDAARPLSVPSGEFWLVHKSGSLLKFHNDGSVELHTAQNLNASVAGNANLAVSGNITSNASQWNHTGPVSITGTLTTTGNISGGANITAAQNVSDQGGTKTMSGMRTTYNSHTHVENNAIGGNTATPNGTM